MSDVRVRFAPSPTGFLHLGGARTALYNWLFVRNQGGTFVLRIEDTDRERSTEEATAQILEAMTWMGLTWDEGPIHQADRRDIYQKYLYQLVSGGLAYRCYCSPEELKEKREKAMREGRKPIYDRKCLNLPPDFRSDKPSVLRFHSPDEGETVIDDLVKGQIVFKNIELDDLVIQKSDGFPTYNFAVVVDDAELSITHVIRGDDHLANTPRQIQLYKALGFDVPKFVHIPMIHGKDKAKLSKRHGAISVLEYRDMGYLPEAFVNYIARLGWSYKDEEFFTVDDLVNKFSIDNLSSSAAIFNPEKLLWLNGQHIIKADPERLADLLPPFLASLGIKDPSREKLIQVIPALQTRAKTMVEMAEGVGPFFLDVTEYDGQGAKKFLTPEICPLLKELCQILEKTEKVNAQGIEKIFRDLTAAHGIKLTPLAQAARLALTGKTWSPPISDVIFLLGKEESIARIRKTIAKIK